MDCSRVAGVSRECDSCGGVSGGLEGCELTLPPSITVDGIALDCNRLIPEEEYAFLPEERIRFQGDACEAVQADRPHRIDYLLGCNLDA